MPLFFSSCPGSTRLSWSRHCLGIALGFAVLGPFADQGFGVEQPKETGLHFLEREIILDGRYLNLPVKVDAPLRTVNIVVDGRTVRAFEIELTEGKPDFWAFTDVSEWRGRKAVIRLDPIGRLAKEDIQKASAARPPAPHVLDSLRIADEIVEARELYHEPLRPQFHFTAPRGWLNDPYG